MILNNPILINIWSILVTPAHVCYVPNTIQSPRNTIQRPNILDKTLKKHATPKGTKQEPKTLNKSSNKY